MTALRAPALVGQAGTWKRERFLTQHPAATEHALVAAIDRFVGDLHLRRVRALAAAQGLWTTCVESRSCGTFLFTPEDLLAPGDSYLMRTMRTSPDREVPCLMDALLAAFQGSLDRVPRLPEVAEGAARTPLQAWGAGGGGTCRPAAAGRRS